MANRKKKARCLARGKEAQKCGASPKRFRQVQTKAANLGRKTRREAMDASLALLQSIVGGVAIRVAQTNCPDAALHLARALRADDVDLFNASVAELANDGIPIFGLRILLDDGSRAVNVFQYAILCECQRVFSPLTLMATRDGEAFRELLDSVCGAVESTPDCELWRHYAGCLYGGIMGSIQRAGCSVAGGARAGQCGRLWNELAAEIEAERQQSILLGSVPEPRGSLSAAQGPRL